MRKVKTWNGVVETTVKKCKTGCKSWISTKLRILLTNPCGRKVNKQRTKRKWARCELRWRTQHEGGMDAGRNHHFNRWKKLLDIKKSARLYVEQTDPEKWSRVQPWINVKHSQKKEKKNTQSITEVCVRLKHSHKTWSEIWYETKKGNTPVLWTGFNLQFNFPIQFNWKKYFESRFK